MFNLYTGLARMRVARGGRCIPFLQMASRDVGCASELVSGGSAWFEFRGIGSGGYHWPRLWRSRERRVRRMSRRLNHRQQLHRHPSRHQRLPQHPRQTRPRLRQPGSLLQKPTRIPQRLQRSNCRRAREFRWSCITAFPRARRKLAIPSISKLFSRL